MRQPEAEDAAIGRFFAENRIAPFRVIYEEFSPRYEIRSSRNFNGWE